MSLVTGSIRLPTSCSASSPQRYRARTALRDFITLEYCMLDGINDLAEQAEALLALLRGDGRSDSGLPCKINLISSTSVSRLRPARRPCLRATPRPCAAVLHGRHRHDGAAQTRGDDIAAACGRLAGEVQDRTRRRRSPPGVRRRYGQRVAATEPACRQPAVRRLHERRLRHAEVAMTLALPDFAAAAC